MAETGILWSGLTGRVGLEAMKAVRKMDDVKIVLGVSRRNMDGGTEINGETFEGVKWRNYRLICPNARDYTEIEEQIGAVVDFSNTAVFEKILNVAIRAEKPLVIGTSGLSNRQLASLYDATRRIPVFYADNYRFKVKEFIDAAVEQAKNGCTDDLHENFYRGKKILPSEVSRALRARIADATGRTIEVYSSATLDKTNLPCEWKIGSLTCRVEGFADLAHDVLRIAQVMATKPIHQGKFYTLDDIWTDIVRC